MDAKQNNDEQQENSSEGSMRTDSESSTDSMPRFLLPSYDSSPPKVISMDDVSSMFNNLRNMELAHEIAINPEFKLQPYEPPNDSLEGRFKTIMHDAFWDLLRQELERDPPSYEHAFGLLAEIKEDFSKLVTERNARLLVRINAALDEVLLGQQAERGLLDFRAYANYVINLLANICAPARDETVAKLREIDDVVDTFRGILETMSLMKLDMANYTLSVARSDIAANSVEYEKAKFSNYLKEFHGNAGFPATEDWLQRHRSAGINSAEEVIYKAYLQFLDYPTDKEFPELLRIDRERFAALSWRGQRLILSASLISIAQAVPVISQRRENRVKLAQQLDILVQHVKQQDQIDAAIDSCDEQIRAFINEALAKEQAPPLSESQQTQLQSQIQQLKNKTSPVRALMTNRFNVFVRVALRSNGNIPPPPPGFGDFEEELVAFANSFRRLVSYNHAVFGEYLAQLLDKQRPSVENVSDAAGSSGGLATGLAQTAKP